MDQPTAKKGVANFGFNPALHSKFMTPGVAKSLTRSDEVDALRTIADNRVLKTLTIGRLSTAQSLLLISRNRSLRTLELGLNAAACAGIPQLVDMPMLDQITLVRIQRRGRLTSDHVEALCAKPLISLTLQCWNMDLAAWAQVATANTRRLSLDFCDINKDAIVRDIAANPRLEWVSVRGAMLNEGNTFILASSPFIENLRVDLSNERPAASEERLTKAWRAAGKLIDTLDLTVSQINLEADGDYSIAPF